MLRNKKRGKRTKEEVFLVVMAIFVIALGFYFLEPSMTGLFLGQSDLVGYSQNLSLELSGNQDYDWDLEGYPEVFELKSVKLTGSYVGKGNVSVYLEDSEGKKYLVLDKETIAEKGILGITGYAIAADGGEEEADDDSDSDDEEEDEEEADDEDEEEADDEDDEVDEEVAEDEDETSDDEEIDAEDETSDDGGEEVEEEEVEEESVETPTDAVEENATEEVPVEVVEEVNVTEEIVEETNITEEINITEEVVNVTDINITEEINITDANATTNLTSGLNATLNESLINITLNGTVGGGGAGGTITDENPTVDENATAEINATTNETIEVIEEIEPETYYVNLTYKEFEPEKLTIRTGDTIVWKNLRGEKAPKTAIIQGARPLYRHIQGEIGPGETFSWTFNKPGTFYIVDGVIVKLVNKIVVEGEPIGEEEEAEIVNETTISFEDVCVETCLLPSGLNLTNYKLVVGMDDGVLTLDGVDYVAENLTEPPLDIKFDVVDINGNLIPAEIDFRDYNYTLNAGESLSLKKGAYNFDVVPENHTIRNLELDEVSFAENLDEVIKLDENLPIADVIQSYAIESLVGFNLSKIRVTAKGNNLYQCVDWNFDLQRCNGEFNLFKNLLANESYSIEINSSSAAFIESIENITNVTYLKVKEDPRYDAIIDSAVMENETLTVMFHHDFPLPLPIRIEGRVTNYTLSHNESKAEENVTLTVPGWDNEHFRIYVGTHTEIIEFGLRLEYDFDVSIEDSDGKTMDAIIKFIDSGTEKTIYEKEITSTDTIVSRGSTATSTTLKVQEGTYDIEIKPNETTIAKIMMYDSKIGASIADFINIDDVNETGNLSHYTEVYAIDPTGFNFTNATVTVTAKGNFLYKCKDWNFSTQTCYGSWVLFKSGLVPGQNYTFTLTPDDPGFGEINLTDATYLDENYNFISNIFDKVSVKENNWSEPIYENRFIRATFQQNLSNDYVIDFYLRNNQSGQTYLQVYNINTTSPVLGESIKYLPQAPGWVYLTLSNISTPADTFDIRVLNDDSGNTSYLEFDYIHDAGTCTGTEYNFSTNSHDIYNVTSFKCGNDRGCTQTTDDPPADQEDTSAAGELNDLNYETAGVIGKLKSKWEGSADFNFLRVDTGIDPSTSISGDIMLRIVGADFKEDRNPVTCGGKQTFDVADSIEVYVYSGVDTVNASTLKTISSGFFYDAGCTTIPTACNVDSIDVNITDLFASAPAGMNFTVRVIVKDNGDDMDVKTIGEVYVQYAEGGADTTPPAIVTNLNNQSRDQTWIYWNWTNPNDSDFNSSVVYLDGVWKVNTSNNFYNATGLSSGTSYTITVHTKDTTGNVNNTDVNSTASTSAPDTQAPTYSNINEPTDPSTYSSSATHNFNITWADDVGVDTVILEFNDVNYSDVSNVGSVYYRNFGALAVGIHNYTWYANDTSDNWNNTGTLTYTVNQQSTILTLSASPSWSEISGTQTTINCTADNSEVTPKLYRDSVEVSIPDIQTLTAGIYNHVCNATATQNYSAPAGQENNLTITAVPGLSLTDSADQETNRTINATYTITITNNGTDTDTYNLTVENINGASTAQLNQSSITIASNQSENVILYVTDDDTVGVYAVNVTAVSNTNVSVSDEISITTTVYGILSSQTTFPSGSPPPIYYEAQNITFQGYVSDELSNLITGATVTFEPIYGSYIYLCSDTTDVGSGYYNCTLNTASMQSPQYYDVRVNASRTYYHKGTFTNSSVFLLTDNQQANLTLNKLPTIQSLNSTTIVYNISDILTNAKGTSQSTNLTDPDANQTWLLGNMGAETTTKNYTLSFTRGSNATLVTLNKSNASGYDPLYDNNLFVESNQPVIVIPENETLKQVTLIKNLVYKNQTTTNVTYEIVIDAVNSGDTDLENIEVTDTDTNLDTKVNLTEGQSWQTSSNLIIQKNPQVYTKSFVKTRASATGDIFYSNQPNITIPGYGGPFDVIVDSLPSSVEVGNSFSVSIETINQNTEIAEDRWLTTTLQDASGTVYDIDIRTIYVGRNQSLTTSIALTAPSSAGTYYIFSEIVWPTATANATKSFAVVSPSVSTSPSAASGGGGSASTGTACGNNICNISEEQGGKKECLVDCGYDCDGDGKGEQWDRCMVTIRQIPDDLKEDIIALTNKINEFVIETEKLKEGGAAVQEALDLIAELEDLIKKAEEKIAYGQFDEARNIIRNAYAKAGTIVVVEKQVEVPITGAATVFEKITISWKFVNSFILIFIVIALIVVGVYYKHQRDEAMGLMLLRARRRKLEHINDMVDKTIDKIYFKK